MMTMLVKMPKYNWIRMRDFCEKSGELLSVAENWLFESFRKLIFGFSPPGRLPCCAVRPRNHRSLNVTVASSGNHRQWQLTACFIAARDTSHFDLIRHSKEEEKKLSWSECVDTAEQPKLLSPVAAWRQIATLSAVLIHTQSLNWKEGTHLSLKENLQGKTGIRYRNT